LLGHAPQTENFSGQADQVAPGKAKDVVDMKVFPDLGQPLPAIAVIEMSGRSEKTRVNRADRSAAYQVEMDVESRSLGEGFKEKAEDPGFVGSSGSATR